MRKDPREEQSEADRLEAQRRRKAELDDLRNVLSSDSGYRLVLRLLAHTRVFESIWSPSAEIHKNAGRQDVGHFIWGEVLQASPEALTKFAMDIKRQQTDQENKEAERNDH